MALIADILLVAAVMGAAVYCMVLSRRLRRFNDLEKGMGGAIAVLSAQVDDMTHALDGARGAATTSSSTLVDLTSRAESVAQRLELLVASLHDLPVSETNSPEKQPENTSKPVAEAPAFRRSSTLKEPPLVLRHQQEVVQ